MKQSFNENQNNLVIGFKGYKGSGKTLAMTLFLYLEYKKGKKIYTNYPVGFPHEYIDVQKLVDLDEQLQNAVIGIDELHMICDSRRSSSKQNMLMSYFVLQSRHRSVNFYYTTQLDGQIDVRIRDNTDINVICQNLFIDSDNDGLNDMFRLLFQDKRFGYIINYERRLYGKPLFDMYTGDEIIDIFTMKQMKDLRKKGKK